MPEIRFSITEKLDKLITRYCDEMGISKAEYLKSLIISDLRKGMKGGDKM
jgi:hypothetical protein